MSNLIELDGNSFGLGQGLLPEKKNHLISWTTVYLPKNQGGLGVLELHYMNIALLAKWWYRFKDPTVSGKWKTLLTIKYSLTGLHIPRCFSFWSGVLSFIHIYEMGINRIVGNGMNTFFWLDRWMGDCALYCVYPNLFRIAANQQLLVSNAFSHSLLDIQFTRQLTGILYTEWQHLLNSLPYSSIFTDPSSSDTIFWRWTSSGLFTVHSLYLWLSNRGILNTSYSTLWHAKIPLKIKIFIWLLRQNKILTKCNLVRRGWQGIFLSLALIFLLFDHG